MTGLFANGEVELFGHRFRTTPDPIEESLVSVFPGKLTIGDSRRVDDPIASSYVMEDWTGGGLKRWMDPTVDFDRFYWSDCATWFTRQLTLGPRARFVSPLLGAPVSATAAVAASGSIGPVGTMLVGITYTNNSGTGETAMSPLTSLTFSSLSGFNVTSPPAHAGATGYYIYASQLNQLTGAVTRCVPDSGGALFTPVAIGTNVHVSVSPFVGLGQVVPPPVGTALTWPDGVLRNVRAGAEYNGIQYNGWDEYLALLDTNEVVQIVGTATSAGNFITDMRVYRCMLGTNAGLSRLVISYRPSTGGTPSGYVVYDGTTISAGSETCQYMTQWDDKLVKIGDDGALRYTVDLANWYNLPGQNVVPVSTSQVTGLATYPDAMWGLDSLQIATTTGLWFYDDIAQSVRATRLSNLPRLLNQGRGIANHKDELYIPTTGVGIDRFSGTTVSAVGLNKDDGLPAEYRGSLQWLATSINFLVAAVSSTQPVPANNPIYAGDAITYASTTLGTKGYAVVYGEPRIGGGWHTLYASPLSDGTIFWVGTSSADNKYRLFFGNNGTLGIIDQYPDIANMLDNSIQEFNQTGTLITPWNEMGWSEIQKQAIRQKFGVKGAGLVANGATCTGTACHITVEYGLDYDETDWYPLATITTAQPPPAYFGTVHSGVSFKAIRYRYTLTRCSNTLHSPVLVWSTMTFLKQMDARWGYRMTLDLTTAEQGITPADQADLLRRMCDPNDLGASQGVFKGWVNGKFVDRYVSVSELVGKVKGGNKQSGLYSIALIAFP